MRLAYKTEKRAVFCRDLKKQVEQVAVIRYGFVDASDQPVSQAIEKTLNCSGADERTTHRGQCCGDCRLIKVT
jgi:hypothetical protein